MWSPFIEFGIGSNTVNSKGSGDASLDHIREILFGAQSRDHESQLKQVDKRISEGLKELREEMRARHGDLDQRIKEEFSTIKAKLRAESNERNEALKTLTRDLAKSTAAFVQVDRGIRQPRHRVKSPNCKNRFPRTSRKQRQNGNSVMKS